MPAATKLVVLPELLNQFHLSSQIDNVFDWKDYFGENIYYFTRLQWHIVSKYWLRASNTFPLILVNVPDVDIRTNAIIVTKADVKCSHFNSHAVGHFQYYFLKVNCQSLGPMKKKVLQRLRV